QKHFSEADKRGQLRLIGSRDGREGSLTIHQDVDLYPPVLDEADRVTGRLAEGGKGWLQVVGGEVQLEDRAPTAGDGVAIEGPRAIPMTGRAAAEILAFDMG